MTAQSLKLAYDYCARVTRAHTENFPVASLLIPKAMRPAVTAIYAFSRIADDFADEPEFARDRLGYLDAWETALVSASAQPPVHPVFIALADTMARFDLPLECLRDLLRAFKMDLTKTRYADDAELLTYCRYSANPVGRLVLHLFGYGDPQLLCASDAICTALQLANHWQDLSVDIDKDRLYIPQSRLQAHGVSVVDIFARRDSAAVRELIRGLVEWTAHLFEAGAPLIDALHGRLKIEIRLTHLGGCAVLEKIRALNYFTLRERPALGKRDSLGLLMRALVRAPRKASVLYP